MSLTQFHYVPLKPMFVHILMGVRGSNSYKTRICMTEAEFDA